MALFKCKMCGGDLEIAEGVTIAECEYCGTKQTVPKAMDENLQNLFNRANTLRIKSEFDKAEKLYEKIIQADTTQSEAYWGLILCKYGIEYVDDPATYKKVPTCHRASYDSIIADDDYKSAIENADLSQRAIYEEQAKEIDRIQKDILALAQKEETYDVFICYKETDADGKRTQDSVIANDIYYQLTQEGFKVFYAAVTLEGKLGSAYEPIIFAALNSAKVMLSIGTKPEYFNAVWVKNEWSRFLKIVKNDRSKLLIPCYRDMDAYELPEEFAHLQAQDMAKIGFINDIVRGIKKVISKDEQKQATVVKETVISGGNANTAPLLKRAFMFLEDGDWNSANEYCEKVLDNDPECAQAYLGKLMAELHVKKQDKLKDQADPFDDSNNYQKAIRFGDEDLVEELKGYIEHINTRNENARLLGIYTKAKIAMNSAKTESDFKAAAIKFESIPRYQDSAKLALECHEKAEVARKDKIYDDAKAYISKDTIQSQQQAIQTLKFISGWRDSKELVKKCEEKITWLTNKQKYDAAKGNYLFITSKGASLDLAANISRIEQAKAEFENLGEFEDSQEMVLKCEEAIVWLPNKKKYDVAMGNYLSGSSKGAFLDLAAKISRIEQAKAEFENLGEFENSQEMVSKCIKEKERIQDLVEEDRRKKEAAAKQARKNKIIAAITIPLVIAVIAFVIVMFTVIIPNIKYNDAIALMDAGKYSEAISAFEAMDGYKDSISKIEECNINIYGEEVWNKIKTVNVGDIYSFGSYEQDNNKSNGQEDIEWLVLAKEGTKILVISKYALDCQPYNTSYTDVTWETCTLRKWLNNNFINAAFSADEKAMIPTVTVSADNISDYSTNPGNTTHDQVFLLSITEVNKYFNSDSARQCKPTDCAVAHGAYVNSFNGNCWWWLRSPGAGQAFADIVNYLGNVDENGRYVNDDSNAVRPAMWINIE